MSNIKQVAGIYEELKGVVLSIKDNGSWFDDDGYTQHVNGIIARVSIICPEIEDIKSYEIKAEYLPNRGQIVNVIPTKTKLNALIGRLKGTYDLDVPLNTNGHTFIQNQSQEQSQQINLVLEWQEKIIKEISKYESGSKERAFLEKLKSSLPDIKIITDILSNTLKIGSEVGLDPDTIRKLLGL